MGVLTIDEYKDKLKFRRELNVTNRCNYNLAKELSALSETEVHFITAFNDITKDAVIKDGNLTVHFLSMTRFRNLITGYMYAKHRLQKEIDKVHPDIIIGIGTEHIFPYVALKSGYPNVIVVHGIMQHIAFNINHLTLYQRFFYLLEKHVLKQAKYIIAINPHVVHSLKDMTKARFYLVENPVDEELFHVDISNDKHSKYVLLVGRVTESKGVFELVKAVNKLKRKNVDVRIKVIGPVDQKTNYYSNIQNYIIKNQLTNNISFLGYQTPKEVRYEMSRSLCLVLPSHVDTAPMAIAEAMAVGIPVIATEVGGIPWMVKDGVTGFLVEPGDIEALAQKIEVLLNNEGLRKQMGNAAIKEARRRFHPKVVAEKTIEVYKQVLGEE